MRDRELNLAVTLASSAAVCDCLGALEPLRRNLLVSTSLRGTSIAAVIVSAGYGTDETTLVGALAPLVATTASVMVAMLGTHEADAPTRASEALFVAISVGMVVMPTVVEELGRRIQFLETGARTSGALARTALALALVAYVGGRLVRAGVSSCSDARDRAFEMYGPVSCGATVSASISAAGGGCVAAGLGALFSLRRGSLERARALCVAAAATTSVLVLCISFGIAEVMTSNPTIFMDGPQTDPMCVEGSLGGEVVGGDGGGAPPDAAPSSCPDLLAPSRRYDLGGRSLGTTVFICGALVALAQAFGDEGLSRSALRGDGVAIGVVGVVALAIHLSGADWESEGVFIESSFVLAVAGIATGALIDEFVGSFIAYSGLYVETIVGRYVRKGEHPSVGDDYYTTLCTRVTMTGLVACLLLAASSALIPYRRPSRLALQGARLVCLAMRGLSVSLLIALLGGVVLYDGSDLAGLLPNQGSGDATWRQMVVVDIVWHYMPVIVWSTLQHRLGGSESIGTRARWSAWIVPTILLPGAYMIGLAVRGGIVPSEYQMPDPYSVVVYVASVFVPVFLVSC